MTSKLSTKGQIVIPLSLRERKNLRPGDILEIEETSVGIFLRKRSKVRPHLVQNSGVWMLQAAKDAPAITSAGVKKVESEVL